MQSIDSERLIYQPPSWFTHLHWSAVFATNQSAPPIHVDLGAGDGGFIRTRAVNHPDTYFLAVERLLGRVRKISRLSLQKELRNLRVLRMEASYAVEYLFPPQSITSITILFPDPWPKRRHQNNRLVQKSFLERCTRCLKPDGWIGMKTDDHSYFQQMIKAIDTCPGLQSWNDVDPKVLLPELTDFEKDFLKEGRQIYFLAAKIVDPARNPMRELDKTQSSVDKGK